MRYLLVLALMAFHAGAFGQGRNIFELSRNATVRVISVSANSGGTGVFVSDQHVLTNFHLVATVVRKDKAVNVALFSDLVVVLPSGEKIGATVVSMPTEADLSPVNYDFALLKLNSKALKSSVVTFASEKETTKVGDDVIFSGYPLDAPGMVTHRGMVSGYDDSKTLIFVQASINKGNSGGALLNSQGQIIGIVTGKEGGINAALVGLREYISRTSSQGSVQIMGVDPLQATREIINTFDKFISTGIGYAVSIRFYQDWLSRNKGALK